MRLFSAINKRLGETVAGFDSTEVFGSFQHSFETPNVFDGIPLDLRSELKIGEACRLLRRPDIFRINNSLFPSPDIGPNLLFDIASIGQPESLPLKLSVPEVKNLKVEIESYPSDDLFSRLSKSKVSSDVSDTLDLNPEQTVVSANLFRRLLPHGVSGKNYQRKTEAQPSLFNGGKKETDGFKKAYKRQKSVGSSSSYQTECLSIWDLILPILMPPVGTDFSNQFELFKPLFKFQPAGIDFLVRNESALLADEMGTGKTVMSTVALKLLFRLGKIRKALIVCPVSLLRTWQDHLQDWASELQLTVVRGTPEIRKLDWKFPAHVYLTTYDTIASDFLSKIKKDNRFPCPNCKKQVVLGSHIVAEDVPSQKWMCPHCEGNLNDYLLNHLPKKASIVDSEIIKSFDLLLIDEAQYIKNRASQRSRAVRQTQPKYKWALTGTPIENRLDDLVAIFGFVKPDLFKGEDFVTPKRAAQLIKPHFLRRLKKDVMKDLPPKVRQEMWLELDPDQRRAYDAMERQGIYDIENMEVVSKVHIFALINKLKQICNFAPNKEKSQKTEELVELVEQIKESGQKVLVFSQYDVEGVSKLEKLLRPFGVSLLKGGMSDTARNAAINRFKKDRDVTVFLATIKTGGVGLTLTEASYVIHFDHWWNPALMWQADDRVHRSGQKSSQVNIYSFWTQNTIEERIYEVLKKKRLLFDEVINGLSEEDIDRMIDIDEWLGILGVKPKTKSSQSRGQQSQPPPRSSQTQNGSGKDGNCHSQQSGPKSDGNNSTHKSRPNLEINASVRKAHTTLEINLGATSADITAAYRKLAKINHPDKVATGTAASQKASEEKMKQINDAYLTLRKYKYV